MTATVTTPEEWWAKLTEETQDRLAADPGAPVPEELRAEVIAANGGDTGYPPFQDFRFRDFRDYRLRGSFIAYIHADNERLLAKIVAVNAVPNPYAEGLIERARRRGLAA